MEGVIIFGSMLVAVLVAAIIGICIETYNWNKGKCRKCGGDLRFFDYDHTASRGYECEHCYHKVWISYKCVDKRKRG